MKIGILQCDEMREIFRPEFSDYPEMFRQLLQRQDDTLEFSNYLVTEHQFPRRVEECDAYLVTGSRSSVYEPLDWIEPTAELIRRITASGRRIVGICFGHQLIAAALGGQVGRSEKGWGVGLHSWDINHQASWMNPPVSTFALLAMHQDQVQQLPEQGIPLAGSDFCPVAAFQIGDSAVGFQGHPEFNKVLSRTLMEYRQHSIGSERVRAGINSLAGDPHSDTIARWMLNFFRGQ